MDWSMFSTLPNEVLDIVSETIEAYRDLFSISLAPRRCYSVFNRRLYEYSDITIDDYSKKIATLALSDSDRIPLTGPHPASLVQHLELTIFLRSAEEDGKLDWEMLETPPGLLRATLALRNIFKHRAALRDVTFLSDSVPLWKMFEEVDFSAADSGFGVLEEFIIGCPVLRKGLEQDLGVYDSLCRSSTRLTRLEFSWSGFEGVHDSDALSQLVQHIPNSCPNLKELSLDLVDGIQRKYFKSIQRVMDDPNFTFPHLEIFRIQYFAIIYCRSFFLRHPGIQKLKFSSEECKDNTIALPGILPNVRHFGGSVTDYLTLYPKSPPSIDCLDVFIGKEWNLSTVEEALLRTALSNTKTVRKLFLTGTEEYRVGLDLEFLATIPELCPRLTHLLCKLSPEASMEYYSVYSVILPNLKSLLHLKLDFHYPSGHTFDVLHNLHSQTISELGQRGEPLALQTIHLLFWIISLDLNVPGDFKRFSFIKGSEKDSWILPVREEAFDIEFRIFDRLY